MPPHLRGSMYSRKREGQEGKTLLNFREEQKSDNFYASLVWKENILRGWNLLPETWRRFILAFLRKNHFFLSSGDDAACGRRAAQAGRQRGKQHDVGILVSVFIYHTRFTPFYLRTPWQHAHICLIPLRTYPPCAACLLLVIGHCSSFPGAQRCSLLSLIYRLIGSRCSSI